MRTEDVLQYVAERRTLAARPEVTRIALEVDEVM
jgi:hypothetical protein